MLVVVAGVLGMPVAVMQVIDVVVVRKGVVSAAAAVDVVVIAEVMVPVAGRSGHRSVDLPSRSNGGLRVTRAAGVQGRGPNVPPALDRISCGPARLEPDRVKK